MNSKVCIFLLLLSANLYAQSEGRKIPLITKEQYHAKGKPCACPEDKMKNNRRCGGTSAFCRGGGDNISNCYDKITTDIELKKQRDEHCPL